MKKPSPFRLNAKNKPRIPVRFSGDQVLSSGVLPDIPSFSDCVVYFPAGLTVSFRSTRLIAGSRKMSLSDSRKLIAGGLGISPRKISTLNVPDGFWWFVTPDGWESVDQNVPVILGLPALVRHLSLFLTDPAVVTGYLVPVMDPEAPAEVTGFVVVLHAGGVMESNLLSLATVMNPQSFILGISSFMEHLVQSVLGEGGALPKEEITWIRDIRNRNIVNWTQVAGTVQDISEDVLGDALRDPPFVFESLAASNIRWRAHFLKVLPPAVLLGILLIVSFLVVRHFDKETLERTRVLKVRHEMLLARLENARMVHLLLSNVVIDLSRQMDLSWGLLRLDAASRSLLFRQLILFRAGSSTYNWFIEGRAPSRLLLDSLVKKTKAQIDFEHLTLSSPRPIYLPSEDLSPSFLFQGQWAGLIQRGNE